MLIVLIVSWHINELAVHELTKFKVKVSIPIVDWIVYFVFANRSRNVALPEVS